MLESGAVDLSVYRQQKAVDLIAQADMLFQNGYYDGSINRSYYAIFSAIRALLALLRLDSAKHGGVLGLFDRYFVKTGIFAKKWSFIAHSAFDARQISDYDDKPPISAEQAQTQLEEAKAFVAEVASAQARILAGSLQLPLIDAAKTPSEPQT